MGGAGGTSASLAVFLHGENLAMSFLLLFHVALFPLDLSPSKSAALPGGESGLVQLECKAKDQSELSQSVFSFLAF